MANVKKFTMNQTGKMFGHYDRTAENGKEHIDWSRTHLNYNLAPDTESKQIDILHQRLSEVKVQKRADVNVFCTWVVTMPKSLPEEKEPEFFQETYRFLEDRYGKENVISAYVHKDEATPHLHFAFVPVVQDKKHERLKVSAKECVNRTDLQKFHGELQKHLEAKLECQVDILNEATREGNKSITELRRESATERLEKATAEAYKMLDRAKNTIKAIEDTHQPIESEYRAKQEWLKRFKESVPKSGIKEYSILGFKFNTVSDEKMREIEITQKEALADKLKISVLEIELEAIKQDFTYQHYREAISQYHTMKRELEAVKNEKAELQQEHQNEIEWLQSSHKVEIKKLQQQLDKYIEKYGELEPEKPKLQYQAEIQQEKSKKIIYKSKSKSQGYDITD